VNPAELRRLQERRVKDHTLTNHAQERMAEFGLTPADLEPVLTDYEQRYPQTGKYAGMMMHQRGEWAMAVDPETRSIITVLRRKIERWEH
jgi:hypothetical protein